jgi:hypothetical protein
MAGDQFYTFEGIKLLQASMSNQPAGGATPNPFDTAAEGGFVNGIVATGNDLLAWLNAQTRRAGSNCGTRSMMVT